MTDAANNDPIEADFLGDTTWDGTLSGVTFDSVDDGLTTDVFQERNIEQDLKEDSPFEGATTKIGDGECVVCGAPTFRPAGLTKAGHRKRVPKYCDLHAPNSTVQATRPNAQRLESQLHNVQEELADNIRLLATLVGPLLPVTGYYAFESADAFTISILKLAKNNQRIVRVLYQAARVAPVYTAASTLAGIGYAVQVDLQKADPYSTISKRLRVDKAYEAVHPDEAAATTNGATNFAGPPRYSTVQ